MNGYAKSLFLCIAVVLFAFLARHIALSQNQEHSLNDNSCSWKICSIDTMKMSRDKARAELNNPQFDSVIKHEAKLIADTGANYMAIDTPYDEEFLPFLRRWVNAAREENLHVWFRGNFSSWEGWFDYQKNLTPDGHMRKSYEFITKNPDLFKDGDIFDACPECENAGHWKQPERNREYNLFIQDQARNLENAFNKIHKKVNFNLPSIIGGRAKEVLDASTVTALGNTVTIDHYFKDPKSIEEYMQFFKDSYQARVLVSEFGAPIPDMNGYMTEQQQADFIETVLEILYRKQALGVNYWVLSEGTPAIVNADGSKRMAYDIVKKYYTPGIITGTIKNTLGENIQNVKVTNSDGIEVLTDEKGNYKMAVPQRTVTIDVDNAEYSTESAVITVSALGQKIKKDFTLMPINPGFMYRMKLFFKNKKWF